jgi:hypothetical protein
MFNKSTFALALVAGVFVNALFGMQSTRADNFLGGDGGSNFGPVNCPVGRVIVGLTGRSGDVIDTMQIICGLNSNLTTLSSSRPIVSALQAVAAPLAQVVINFTR